MKRQIRSAAWYTVVCSILIACITITCVLNRGLWPYLIPAALILGMIGLAQGSRASNINPALTKLRQRVTVRSLIAGMVVYIIVGLLSSLRPDSDLSFPIILALLPLVFPLCFGLAQLLTTLLIPDSLAE